MTAHTGPLVVSDDGFGLTRIDIPEMSADASTLRRSLHDAVADAIDARGAEVVAFSCRVGDEDAWRAAWSCGFTAEVKRRLALTHNGKRYDAWTASLLATDTREPKTTWLDPHTIEGQLPRDGRRIVLRQVLASDRERYLETANDPETEIWLGTIPMPRTSDEFDAMLASRIIGPSLGSHLTWTVADAATDDYLGNLSVFGFDSLDYKSAEVGYRTHPDARGRGVLTTSLRLVIDHAFTSSPDGGLGLERLSLGAADSNLASQGVARSCGFIETGRDRACYDLPDGTVVDLIRFDLLIGDPR